MAESEVKEISTEGHFVSFLQRLEQRQDRGALAKLRRSVGKDTSCAEALRLIAPYLPHDQGRSWRVQCYELVAGLFAMHPLSGGNGNFGETFRDPRIGDHESVQKRFVALLDSDTGDLPHRLRQAVSLAKSKNVPVHWVQLLTDLLHWDDESRYVQYKWARAYWGSAKASVNQETAKTPSNPKEGE